MVALLPLLPEKAVEGLKQLGIDPAGKSLADLFDNHLPVGHRVGTPQPLFPRVDEKS